MRINDLFNMLLQKPMFKTKEDIFKKLDFSTTVRKCSEPFEYLSRVFYSQKYDMNDFVKQVGCMHIKYANRDLNID